MKSKEVTHKENNITGCILSRKIFKTWYSQGDSQGILFHLEKSGNSHEILIEIQKIFLKIDRENFDDFVFI